MASSHCAEDWLQLGIQFLRSKSISSAIECFRKAVKLEPSAPALSYLGSCLFFDDREIEAEEVFLEGLSKYPEAKEIFFHFACMRVDQARFLEAQELFEKGLQLEPSDSVLQRGLAYCKKAQEKLVWS